jgi:hypothetical protein
MSSENLIVQYTVERHMVYQSALCSPIDISSVEDAEVVKCLNLFVSLFLMIMFSLHWHTIIAHVLAISQETCG